MADKLPQFGARYFTGAQASLFVGDVWIDEVYGVQFAASQNVVPVYGYASTLFDAVARGKALTQGYFEINFVEEGYLYAALYNAGQSKGLIGEGSDAHKIAVSTEEHVAETMDGQVYTPPSGLVENVQVAGKVADALRIQQDLAALQKFVPDAKDAADQAMARAEANALSKKRVRTTNALLSAIADLDIAQLDQMASQMGPRVSINMNALNVVYSMIPFSLAGYFGLPEEARANGTLKVLRNCFLTSNEMVIGANDEPVKERYAFICRSHV